MDPLKLSQDLEYSKIDKKKNATILDLYRISKPKANATKASGPSMAKHKFRNSTPEIFGKKLERGAKRKGPQEPASAATKASGTPWISLIPDLDDTASLLQGVDMTDTTKLEISPREPQSSNKVQVPASVLSTQTASSNRSPTASSQGTQPLTSVSGKAASQDLSTITSAASTFQISSCQRSLKRKFSVNPTIGQAPRTLESEDTPVKHPCHKLPSVFRFIQLSADSLVCPPQRKKAKKSSLGTTILSEVDQPATPIQIQAKHNKIITRLRVTKPLQAEMNMDVWRHVLAYCPLDFLLKARTVCRSFSKALSHDLAWKDARLNTYGTDLPGPLPGLSEMQYADLLTGIGCQSKGCNQKARKTYWAFQRRWCEKCLKAKVMFKSENRDLEIRFPQLFECLTFATFDSWRKYGWVGNMSDFPEPRDWQKEQRWPEIGYERTAVYNLMDEIDRLEKPGEAGQVMDNEGKEAWFTATITARKEWMTKLQAVEHYVEREKRKRIENGAQLRLARAEFFKERAQALDPPFSADTLGKIAAYHHAVSITREPTEKSWQELLPKLQAQRAEAEAISYEERRIALMPDGKDIGAIGSYRDKEERFCNLDAPEQILILIMADKVIAKLGLPNRNKTRIDNTHWQTAKFDPFLRVPYSLVDAKAIIVDCDIVQIILRAIFDTYEALPDYWKSIAEYSIDCSRYRLCMADAQMVFENKILPIIIGWKDKARTKAATSFRCPGCKRTEKNGDRTFYNLFQHIYQVHAPIVGEFGYFRVNDKTLPDGVSFPWYRIDWPRNLPMLSRFHSTDGTWDKEGRYESVAIIAPREEPMVAQNPFQDRQASGYGISPTSSLADTIVNVSKMLRSTAIADIFKTQIALRYVLSLNLVPDPAEPSVDEWTKLGISLEREKLNGVFRTRCKLCCVRPDYGKNKFVNRAQPLGLLHSHFRRHHYYHSRGQRESFPDILELPSERELGTALAMPGNETAMTVFEQLFTKEQTSEGTVVTENIGELDRGE